MGGIRKKNAAGSAEEREVKEALKKKCRILAKMWDPRIKGCCFVPARSERCCAIRLQIGTRLNAVAVCIFAIAFQVFYGLGFGTIEYNYATSTSLSLTQNAYCGLESATYGFGGCLGVYVARLVGDVVLAIFCVMGFISAPFKKINANMLETRHCQATTFFIGLCVGLIFHTVSMFYSFALWGSGIPELCVNDTASRLGSSAPWNEIFCESGGLVQGLLALAQIVFIAYLLYVMLITLAYRGWLIILEMKQKKGFRSIDWSDDEQEDEPPKSASAKVTPIDDELEKALEGMLAEDNVRFVCANLSFPFIFRAHTTQMQNHTFGRQYLWRW